MLPLPVITGKSGTAQASLLDQADKIKKIISNPTEPSTAEPARIEESVLGATYPDEYPDYERRVKRLVPCIW
jgi:hypothetical protein